MSQQPVTVKASAPAFPVATVLTLIFVVLKLTGVIAWSWVWVLSPIWISLLLVLILLILLVIGVLFAAVFLKKK